MLERGGHLCEKINNVVISEFEQVVIFGGFIYHIGICECFKINQGFLLHLLFKCFTE